MEKKEGAQAAERDINDAGMDADPCARCDWCEDDGYGGMRCVCPVEIGCPCGEADA